MTRSKTRLLALDLEGTLISNAISVFPRPGLREFLDLCASRFERVVLFTAVSEARAIAIARLLADEGTAPEWFGDVECVTWDGPFKDLALVDGYGLEETLLVDDREGYVHPQQMQQWLRVTEFCHPYSQDDRALVDLRSRLEARLQGSP